MKVCYSFRYGLLLTTDSFLEEKNENHRYYFWYIRTILGRGCGFHRLFQRASRSRAIALTIVLAAVLTTTVSAGLVFVEPQERGVVISAISPKGYREQALQPDQSRRRRPDLRASG